MANSGLIASESVFGWWRRVKNLLIHLCGTSLVALRGKNLPAMWRPGFDP